MAEKDQEIRVEEEHTCNCEEIKSELAATKSELDQVKEQLEQYKKAYNELAVRYDRLVKIHANAVDFATGL